MDRGLCEAFSAYSIMQKAFLSTVSTKYLTFSPLLLFKKSKTLKLCKFEILKSDVLLHPEKSLPEVTVDQD